MLAFVPGAGCISNLVTTGPGKTDTTSRVVYEGLGYSDAFNTNSDLGRALSEITSDFAYGFGREAGNPTAREISSGRKI